MSRYHLPSSTSRNNVPSAVRLASIGKIFIMAIVLDTIYQLMVLKSFYLGELLLVVMVTAILPYLVLRSAVSLLMRRVYRKHPAASPDPNSRSGQ